MIELLAAADPGDIPDGYAAVLVAAITSVVSLIATVGVAIISGANHRRLGRVEKDAASARDDAAVTRDHTANTHTTNMRAEMDERNEAIMSALSDIRSEQSEAKKEQIATRKDIGGLRSEMRQERLERHALSERVTEHDKSLAEISSFPRKP